MTAQQNHVDELDPILDQILADLPQEPLPERIGFVFDISSWQIRLQLLIQPIWDGSIPQQTTALHPEHQFRIGQHIGDMGPRFPMH
jgi:hypothetical protein